MRAVAISLIGCELIVFGDWIRAVSRDDAWEMAFDAVLFGVLAALVWALLRMERR